MIGSHEPAGTIAAIGSDVKNFKLGDRVGSMNTYGYCDTCDTCTRAHQYQICDNSTGMLGLTLDGGFSEYMRADARVVSRIPDSIPFTEAAPLLCAGATVYGAIMATEPKPDDWLVVIGLGGLGHLGIQYTKALGCHDIAMDNRSEAIDLTNSVPAHLRPDKTYLINNDTALDTTADELAKGFYDTNPGVDKVVICTEARSLIAWSQKFLRKHGVLADVGLPSTGPFEVDSFALNFKQQTIRGRLLCTPSETQGMIDFHAKHGCRVHVDKTFRVEEANDLAGYYLRKDLKGRVVMVFD